MFTLVRGKTHRLNSHSDITKNTKKYNRHTKDASEDIGKTLEYWQLQRIR